MTSRTHMSPSRENTGSDQVARLRCFTSWSRQLATGDGATRTRATTTMVPSIYDYVAAAVSRLLCWWCVVREKACFVVDCVAEGIVVEHCCCACSASFGPRTTRHKKMREEAATKTERRAFGGYLLYVVHFGRGGYQCALLQRDPKGAPASVGL